MMCKTIVHFARFQTSAMEQLRSFLSWDVVQHRLVVTDVSGQHIAPIFKIRMTLADRTNMLS